ncbi:GNAT family N-acetyltransferase [Rickettsiales bacterium]|nr:GNAT family N-acetyltransferase [Rickettsiales bacterium]
MTTKYKNIDLNNTEHISSIKSMLCDYFGEIGISLDDPKTNFVKHIEKIYQPPNYILAAFDGQKIIGFVFLKSIGENIGEIQQLYVSNQQRGKKIGQLLLENIIKTGLKEFNALRLDSKYDLVQAIALYRKLGFYEIERYNDNPHAQIFFEIS